MLPPAGRGGLLELRPDVVGAEGHVVDTLAAVRDELGDRAVRRGRLQQFDVHPTGVEERRAHLLRGDFFAAEAGEAQPLFIERNRHIRFAGFNI